MGAWVLINAAWYYVVIGMALGIHMGANQDFTLAPVHAHLNFVGWASMALFAFYYNAVPAAAERKLAKVHFWVAQIGLVLFMPSLVMLLKGDMSATPVLIVGELLTGASMLIFAYTVWRNKAD
jgi:hypothetical protein